GERDLPGRSLFPLGPALRQLHQGQVVREVLRRESWLDGADVTRREPRVRVNRTGEELHAERAPGHEADTEFLTRWDHLRFRSAPEHRVLVLDCCDRL